MANLNINISNVKPMQTPAEIQPSTRSWSKYQQAIFAFVEQGTGNAVIEAVAGSGKSTTIIEGMRRIPAGATSIFLAFNKAIAEELKAKGVNARTFHSLTYSAVLRAVGANSVTTDKLRVLCKQIMTGEEFAMYAGFACRLVGLAKQSGVGVLVDDVEEVWMELVNHHDLELENENASYTEAVLKARQLLEASNRSDMVDFDDMLFLAVRNGVSLPKFDFVFVDEAQDTNAIQRALLRKLLKQTSRIIAVGDPAQAIYGFRGADSNSLNLIASEFNCVQLPLTVSYRCPTSVVKYAKRWVSHIEAADGAQEGVVTSLGTDWNPLTFVAQDLVVCRTSAPLLSLGYSMLRAKQPVTILGREIGQGLVALVDKMKARDLDDLEFKLAKWVTRECEKAIAKDDEKKVEQVQDKVDALACIIDSMPESERSIPALKAVITTLFSESSKATILCTIHKSKGLEADNVYWLNASECPSRWAKQDWQVQQEKNLCYVAVTRAKKTLTIIETARK